MIITTDKQKLDIRMIYEFLSQRSYWAQERTLEQIKTSIENSVCFGAFDENNRQIGFARVVTDKVVFAWIMDVFVLEEYRGKGVGKKIMESIINHPKLAEVSKIGLATKDAHGLYQQYGFNTPMNPEYQMERKKL